MAVRDRDRELVMRTHATQPAWIIVSALSSLLACCFRLRARLFSFAVSVPTDTLQRFLDRGLAQVKLHALVSDLDHVCRMILNSGPSHTDQSGQRCCSSSPRAAVCLAGVVCVCVTCSIRAMSASISLMCLTFSTIFP